MFSLSLILKFNKENDTKNKRFIDATTKIYLQMLQYEARGLDFALAALITNWKATEK